MDKLKTALIILSMTICCMSGAEFSWFEEKTSTTTLHVYIQTILTGPNATVYPVAAASVTADSPTMFGQVLVEDSKMTAAPHPDAPEIGRVQVLAVSTGMHVLAYSYNVNFFFTSGKYAGCTVTVGGRNQIGDRVREVPVIGGTGLFRFARGYAITDTYPNDDAANRLVLEYWIHVTSGES